MGSYYALADDIGGALAVSIAPEGIVAECVDAYGDPFRGPTGRSPGPPGRTMSPPPCGPPRRTHGTAPA